MMLSKPDLSKAPKRPLTPYMRFSKNTWKTVKAEFPTLTVCEIGSKIGKLWRDMEAEEKKVYNDGFINEKKEYEIVLADYMKETGLTVSEIYKKKSSKKDRLNKKNTQKTIKEHVRNALLNAKNANANQYQGNSGVVHVGQPQIMQGAMQPGQTYNADGQQTNNGQMQQGFPQFVFPNISNVMNPQQQYHNGRPLMYIQSNGMQPVWNEQLPHFSQVWTTQNNGAAVNTSEQQGTPGQGAVVPMPAGQQGFVVQPNFNQQGIPNQPIYFQQPAQMNTNSTNGNFTPSQANNNNQQETGNNGIPGNFVQKPQYYQAQPQYQYQRGKDNENGPIVVNPNDKGQIILMPPGMIANVQYQRPNDIHIKEERGNGIQNENGNHVDQKPEIK